MSRTSRRIRTKQWINPTLRNKRKKNKIAWRVFYEEKNHVQTTRGLTKHTGKVHV